MADKDDKNDSDDHEPTPNLKGRFKGGSGNGDDNDLDDLDTDEGMIYAFGDRTDNPVTRKKKKKRSLRERFQDSGRAIADKGDCLVVKRPQGKVINPRTGERTISEDQAISIIRNLVRKGNKTIYLYNTKDPYDIDQNAYGVALQVLQKLQKAGKVAADVRISSSPPATPPPGLNAIQKMRYDGKQKKAEKQSAKAAKKAGKNYGESDVKPDEPPKAPVS